MITYLTVMGWILTGFLGVVAVLALACAVLCAVWPVPRRQPAARPGPEVGDDTIAMVRQSRADDKVLTALEAELAEMDKRIRGEL